MSDGAELGNAAGYPPRLTRSRLLMTALAAACTLILTAAGIWLVQSFVLRSYWVQSGSMEPILRTNDRVLATIASGVVEDLERGDIIVFTDPGGWLPSSAGESTDSKANSIIKRVIGLPGDRVSYDARTGTVTVNGKQLVENYVALANEPSTGANIDTVVPADSLWVMGDNRNLSSDSRSHIQDHGEGFVPIASVEGIIFMRFDVRGIPDFLTDSR